MENKMFCFQCQEAAGCRGCTICGVCGKKPEVAAMQDLLVHVTAGLSDIATRMRADGQEIPAEINHLVTTNLFVTITNVNFDREAIVRRIIQTLLRQIERPVGKPPLLDEQAKRADDHSEKGVGGNVPADFPGVNRLLEMAK